MAPNMFQTKSDYCSRPYRQTYMYIGLYYLWAGTPQVPIELLHWVVEHFVTAREQDFCTTFRDLHKSVRSFGRFLRLLSLCHAATSPTTVPHAGHKAVCFLARMAGTADADECARAMCDPSCCTPHGWAPIGVGAL